MNTRHAPCGRVGNSDGRHIAWDKVRVHIDYDVGIMP